MRGHTLAEMSLSLIVALCDTTLYVYPLTGGKVEVKLKKYDCLIMRGDVAHIGGASEHSQTEILHIYIDSPVPGCQRRMFEDGRESATFSFSEVLGYPSDERMAKEKAAELGPEEAAPIEGPPSKRIRPGRN
jgi:hypothetical protein